MPKFLLLVTRPPRYNLYLAKKVEEIGGQPIICPTIDTRKIACNIKLAKSSIVIFTSKNSVDSFFSQVDNSINAYLLGTKFLGISKITAKYLEQTLKKLAQDEINDWYKINIGYCGNNSSSLLQHSWLVNIKQPTKVFLIAGKNGLTKIQNNLRQNKLVKLIIYEVYERYNLSIDKLKIDLLINEKKLPQDKKFILASSGSALHSIKVAIEPKQWEELKKLPLLVFSERIKKIADAYNWLGKIYQTNKTSDQGVIECIKSLT